MNKLKTKLRNGCRKDKALRNKFNKKNGKYPILKNKKTFLKRIKDHIKEQRHYFANKGLSTQGYGEGNGTPL